MRYTVEMEYLPDPANTFETVSSHRYEGCLRDICRCSGAILRTLVNMHNIREMLNTGTSRDVFMQTVYHATSSKGQLDNVVAAREVAKTTKDFLMLNKCIDDQTYSVTADKGNVTNIQNNISIFALLEQQGINVTTGDILTAILGKAKEAPNVITVEESTLPIDARLTSFSLSRQR